MLRVQAKDLSLPFPASTPVNVAHINVSQSQLTIQGSVNGQLGDFDFAYSPVVAISMLAKGFVRYVKENELLPKAQQKTLVSETDLESLAEALNLLHKAFPSIAPPKPVREKPEPSLEPKQVNQKPEEKKAEVSAPAPAPAPKAESSSWSPPTSPIKDPKRKRLNANDAALFERFDKILPKKNAIRRTAEESQQLEIARSYLLDERPDIVHRWMRYLKS